MKGQKMNCRTWIVALVVLCTGLSAAASQKGNMNLVFGVPFKPVYVHNELTGIYGWGFWDFKQIAYQRDPKNRGPLLDGRDIFKIDCKDGVFSLRFKDAAPDGYCKYTSERSALYPELWSLPETHAPRYHVVCEVKITKGKLALFGKTVKAAPDWQKLDFTTRPGPIFISLFQEPGTFFAIRNFSVTAEYDRIGGSIALPDGGKLTALVMPENASFALRRCVYNWRGWLWKLTGTALPIEEAAEVKPRAGKLVFLPGKIPCGGYDLSLNKEGGTLVYSTDFSVINALYNYLRELGYKEYDRNHATPVPAAKADRVLPFADTKNRPKFMYFTGGNYAMPRYNCGVWMADVETGIANWYAIPSIHISGHCSNQLMPPNSARRVRPESQMMFSNGRRQTETVERRPMLISPCLTEPAARAYLQRSIMDVMRAFDFRKEFPYCLGDGPDSFCHCPGCMAKNADKSGKSYASVFFDFMNEAAERAEKEKTGIPVQYIAYHTYTTAPAGKKVSGNMVLNLCLTGLQRPCNVHLNCELNNAGPWKKNLADWTKLIDRRRIGFSTYDAHNPYMLMEYLDFLNKHGCYELHMFAGLPSIELYTIYRWNQGDDPKKIVDEYYEGVYGKEAGKYLVEVQKLIYEYDKKYQHKPGEFSFSPGRMHYRESLDRKTFDAIYSLFDKAEKTMLENKLDVRPLLWEKYSYMETDFRKYPRSGCYTSEELNGFAKRLSEFVRICALLCREKRYPYYLPGREMTVSHTPPRRYLQDFCGLILTNTVKNWTDEPVIREFMKNPVKMISGTPETTPGCWKFPGAILRGGESGGILRRASSGKGRMVAGLELKNDLRGTAVLLLSGWDDEKPGKTTFRVTVNGKEIFHGPNTFPETASPKSTLSGFMYMVIPEGLLKKGENRIAFENTVPDDPKKATRQLRDASRPEDGFTMKQDYFWGWLGIEEVRIVAPDHEYLRFANGEQGTAWGVYTPDKPYADVKTGSGKVSFKTMGSLRNSGVWADRRNKWILPAGVRFKLRITYSATGKGRLGAGFFGYPCDRERKFLRKMDYQLARLQLEEKPKTVEKILTTQNHEFICPVILHTGTGTAEITEFSLEPLPPEK